MPSFCSQEHRTSAPLSFPGGEGHQSYSVISWANAVERGGPLGPLSPLVEEELCLGQCAGRAGALVTLALAHEVVSLCQERPAERTLAFPHRSTENSAPGPQKEVASVLP